MTKERRIIIYLAITAVVLLAGMPACSGNNKSPNDQKPSVITINPDHQRCELDQDCVLTYTDCSWCDCGTPVNKEFEDYYQDLYEDTCRDYQGPVCEIYCPEVQLVCASGRCETVDSGDN